MSVSSIARRRKTTTYGKASRKLTVATAEAFAKATQAEAPDVEHATSDWQRDIASVLGDNAGASVCHTGTRTSRENKTPSSSIVYDLQMGQPAELVKNETISASTDSHSLTTNRPFDKGQIEDKCQQGSSASYGGPPKRQKISPEPFGEDFLIAYDDASLQRHIAVQSRNDFKRHPPSTSNGSISRVTPEKRSCSPINNEPDHAQERTVFQQKVPKPVVNVKDRASHRVKALLPRQIYGPQSTTLSSEVCKVTRTPVSSDTVATPNLEDGFCTASRQLDDDNETLRPDGYLCPPKTPPGPTKLKGGRTTPHERGLWHKLLAAYVPNMSPSTFTVPRLSLTDRKNNGDQSHEDGYIAEDSESSSIGDISEFLKTESSAVSDAITVETSASAHSQNVVGLYKERTLSTVPQDGPSLQTAGSKVTYAGQRSYLTGNDVDEVAMLSTPIAPEPVSAKEFGYGAIGARVSKSHPISSFEDQGRDSHDSQGGAMRSIHELREAGGHVRLVGELEAILDDMEEGQPPSDTTRRMRLLDLVAKLQEPSNSRIFIDQGLEARLLAHAGVSTDLITNSLLAMAILQLLAGPTTTPFLSQVSDPRIVDFLIDLLGLDQSLASQARLRGYNLSKYSRQKYSDICNSITESPIWRAGKPSVLSCHVLTLQCLEYLVRQTLESGSLSEVLPAYAVRRIVATSVPPLSTPLPQCTPMLAIHLELAISILGSYTISSAAEGQGSLWEGPTLERLTGLLPLLHSWDENQCGMSRSLTLRLYVNLTNKNPALCEEISTPEVVEVICEKIVAYFDQLSTHAIGQQHPMLLDDLILSLGTLVNLAESSARVSRLVTTLHWQDRSYLAVFMELYTAKSKGAAEVYSEEETNLNVAFGYLSVLLGAVCLDSGARAWVSSQFHDGSLVPLVSSLEEFLKYNRKAGQGPPYGDIEGESVRGYVDRLQGLVESLKS